MIAGLEAFFGHAARGEVKQALSWCTGKMRKDSQVARDRPQFKAILVALGRGYRGPGKIKLDCCGPTFVDLPYERAALKEVLLASQALAAWEKHPDHPAEQAQMAAKDRAGMEQALASTTGFQAKLLKRGAHWLLADLMLQTLDKKPQPLK